MFEQEKFYRRDGTVCDDGQGICRRYWTRRDDGTILTTVLPSRPAVTAVTVPGKHRDKPWKILMSLRLACLLESYTYGLPW